jgi:hypothetical protein
MRHLNCLPVILLCLADPAVCQDALNDSRTVQAVYAKLMIASQIHQLMEGRPLSSQDERLDVELSDLRSGPLADIRATLLSQLVTKPSGWVLQASAGEWTFTDDKNTIARTTQLNAEWQEAPDFTEDWDVPMERALAAMGGLYSRYVSFNAKASLQGRQRRYAATFLFGRDESGRTRVLPLDHIVGSALETSLTAPVSPGPLLLHPFVDRPEVRALINSLRAPADCALDNVSKLCCSPTSRKCGLPMEQLPVKPLS